MLRVFILVLVLATVFRRRQRVILWLVVIVIFMGSMLLVGLGRIDPVKDNRVDSVVMTGVVFTLAFPIAFQQGKWNGGKDVFYILKCQNSREKCTL